MRNHQLCWREKKICSKYLPLWSEQKEYTHMTISMHPACFGPHLFRNWCSKTGLMVKGHIYQELLQQGEISLGSHVLHLLILLLLRSKGFSMQAVISPTLVIEKTFHKLSSLSTMHTNFVAESTLDNVHLKILKCEICTLFVIKCVMANNMHSSPSHMHWLPFLACSTVVPLLCDHPFCQAKAVTQEGWPLVEGIILKCES